MRLDLAGTWDVRSADGLFATAGEVPGTVFLYMEQEGLFGPEGVFFGEENRKCQELARRDFVFSRSFTIENDLVSCDGVFLEADGLDTLARIRINGVDFAGTANMHRRWMFDIKNALVPGENTIEIVFLNTLDYIDREHARRPLGHSYWHMPDYAYQGFNMIRKSHCSYGWDWGPIIPDAGIYRPIAICAYSCGRIDGLRVVQDHSGDEVTLEIEPLIGELRPGALDEITLDLTVTAPGGEQSFFLLNTRGTTRVRIDSPRLWWPNGLGEQPLYRLDVRLNDGKTAVHRHIMDIGLRTVTVKREPDEQGESFTLTVNGVEVFARGADLIPGDVFLTRFTGQRIEYLVDSMVASNFNFVRVWGGGVYPEDSFFDLCDRAGLVVWQDFMFACASYDVDNPLFLDNIREEIRDTVRRIRHHACLGLLCGNNEMEWGTLEWDPRPDPEMKEEYLRQYQDVIPAVVAEECPEVFYWPSSPSSGGSFDDPNSPDRGDTHFWKVWHGGADYDEYTRHYFRFMSEFGFESFPSMKTIRSFTPESELNVFSPVMEDHQRCRDGNRKILAYLSRYFRFPKDLESLVYLSQLSQAEALRHGIEHWRRNRGRCMGSVYWQLNDNWPVASWSSIDYYGRWKALQYAVKRSYAGLLLSVQGNDTEVSFWLSNEGTKAADGRLSWQLVSPGGAVLAAGTGTAGVPAFASQEVLTLSMKVFLEAVNKAGLHSPGRDALLYAEFDNGSGQVLPTVYFFGPYKALNLCPAEISCTVAQSGSDAVITVYAARPGLFIELDLDGTDRVFSDNWFCLSGGTSRTVTAPLDGISAGEFESRLLVRSLFDSY